MNNLEKENIIALSLVKGIGSVSMKKSRATLIAFKNNIDLLLSINNKVSAQQFQEHLNSAKKIIEDCNQLGVYIVTIVDDEYPRKLLAIKDPPPVLYLRGNINLLDNVVGIVGTRNSSELGNKIANKIGLYFNEHWSICSGLLEGIGKNSVCVNNEVLPNIIGVLSGGVNYESTSSSTTQYLAEKVLINNGLLISEFEPNKKEDQFSTSKVHRIIAGISNALILIQSSLTGGSKHALKTFSELARPLGVVEFNTNQEYLNDEIFSANRLLLSKQKEAIVEMCEIDKIEKIKISKILCISNSDDYKLLEDEIKLIK
jgi:DNA processing protein